MKYGGKAFGHGCRFCFELFQLHESLAAAHSLMKLLENLRETLDRIKKGRSGRRFMEYYRYRKRRAKESIFRTIATLSLAFALILIGIVLGPMPIAPGFLFLIPGIAILVARSRWLARMLDRFEVFVRKALGKAR